jgi:hypothetical protein
MQYSGKRWRPVSHLMRGLTRGVGIFGRFVPRRGTGPYFVLKSGASAAANAKPGFYRFSPYDRSCALHAGDQATSPHYLPPQAPFLSLPTLQSPEKPPKGAQTQAPPKPGAHRKVC